MDRLSPRLRQMVQDHCKDQAEQAAEVLWQKGMTTYADMASAAPEWQKQRERSQAAARGEKLPEDDGPFGAYPVARCGVCQESSQKDGSALLRCGQCKGVWYCCREHQREDWKEHKNGCELAVRLEKQKKEKEKEKKDNQGKETQEKAKQEKEAARGQDKGASKDEDREDKGGGEDRGSSEDPDGRTSAFIAAVEKENGGSAAAKTGGAAASKTKDLIQYFQGGAAAKTGGAAGDSPKGSAKAGSDADDSPTGSPAKAPDERPFSVKSINNAGLGVVAKRDIRRGETLIEEDPLLSTPSTLMKETVRTETGEHQSSEIEDLYNQLTPEQQKRFMELSDCKESKNGEKTIKGTFLTNNLTNRLDSSAPDNGGSVFYEISRFNHSCSPNAFFIARAPSTTGIEKACIRACRDIKAGEEIYISYCKILVPRAVRQKELKDHYTFDCTCSACSTKDVAESDEQRVRLGTLVEKYCVKYEDNPQGTDNIGVLKECLEAIELGKKEVIHVPWWEAHFYQHLQSKFQGIADGLAKGEIEQGSGPNKKHRYAQAAEFGWKAVEATALNFGYNNPIVGSLMMIARKNEACSK